MDSELKVARPTPLPVVETDNLPAIEQSPLPAVETARALTSIAQSLQTLSAFISNGGLQNLTQTVVRANGALSLLQAVITKDGFDVRRIKQYGIELTQTVEAVLGKYAQSLKESRDPELHDAEKDFNKAEGK